MSKEKEKVMVAKGTEPSLNEQELQQVVCEMVGLCGGEVAFSDHYIKTCPKQQRLHNRYDTETGIWHLTVVGPRKRQPIKKAKIIKMPKSRLILPP